MTTRRLLSVSGLVVAAALTLHASGAAQRRGFRGPVDVKVDTSEFSQYNTRYDGRFTFVRFRFTPAQYGYGGGGGFFGGIDYKWDHDYPRADQHFSKLLTELTSIIGRDDGGNILGADDPELFKYPVAYVSEPGFWTVTPKEAENLRAYLKKGGFMILDDFAGGYQLAGAEQALRQILPDMRLIRLDASHPIFHSFFEIDTLNFMHPYYNVPSAFLGIFEDNDPEKRLMVILDYNNDIGESWEWSDTGFIPIDLTNTAYKLGVNYMVYALTH